MDKKIAIEFAFMRAVAPTIVERGLALQERLINCGHAPEQCKVGDDDIPTAYAKYARVWAEALTEEFLRSK